MNLFIFSFSSIPPFQVACSLAYSLLNLISAATTSRLFIELDSTQEPQYLVKTSRVGTASVEVIVASDHTQWHTLGRIPLDERSARLLENTQHPQEIDIDAPGGIRTRNPNTRAAADPRLRALGHRNRRFSEYYDL